MSGGIYVHHPSSCSVAANDTMLAVGDAMLGRLNGRYASAMVAADNVGFLGACMDCQTPFAGVSGDSGESSLPFGVTVPDLLTGLAVGAGRSFGETPFCQRITAASG